MSIVAGSGAAAGGGRVTISAGEATASSGGAVSLISGYGTTSSSGAFSIRTAQGGSGDGATAVCAIQSGTATCQVSHGGSGYQSAPQATVDSSGCQTSAAQTVTTQINGGSVNGLQFSPATMSGCQTAPTVAIAGPETRGLSGSLSFTTGDSMKGSSGIMVLRTGSATLGTGGSVSVVVGTGTSAAGGRITASAGEYQISPAYTRRSLPSSLLVYLLFRHTWLPLRYTASWLPVSTILS